MGEVWDKEKQIDPKDSESYREEIYEFISKYHSTTLSFMMTMRKKCFTTISQPRRQSGKFLQLGMRLLVVSCRDLR